MYDICGCPLLMVSINRTHTRIVIVTKTLVIRTTSFYFKYAISQKVDMVLVTRGCIVHDSKINTVHKKAKH